MSEHRRSPRHHLNFKVIFDDGESYNAGEVEDISETGLYLRTSTGIPAESIVRFDPSEPGDDDALFEVAARVVRCDSLRDRTDDTAGLFGIAVEFVAMTPQEKAGVAKMIEHLEAKKRHRTESGIRDPLLGVIVDEDEAESEA